MNSIKYYAVYDTNTNLYYQGKGIWGQKIKLLTVNTLKNSMLYYRWEYGQTPNGCKDYSNKKDKSGSWKEEVYELHLTPTDVYDASSFLDGDI